MYFTCVEPLGNFYPPRQPVLEGAGAVAAHLAIFVIMRTFITCDEVASIFQPIISKNSIGYLSGSMTHLTILPPRRCVLAETQVQSGIHRSEEHTSELQS